MTKRRTHPRTEKNFLVVIGGRIGSVIRNVVDISKTGMRFGESEVEFHPGQQVRVTFGPALNELYFAQAKVVRNDHNSTALCFENSLDPETLDRVLAV